MAQKITIVPEDDLDGVWHWRASPGHCTRQTRSREAMTPFQHAIAWYQETGDQHSVVIALKRLERNRAAQQA
jgi:hypothetical protein